LNIVLTGPMGSGKTKLGQKTAIALNMKFIDTDALIVKKTGMSINDIFAEHGEIGFRKHEEKVVAEVSKLDNHIIATGGGVVLNPVNMRLLRTKGIIIYLNASFETLYERLKDKKDRPLLKHGDFKKELKKHSQERISLYQNTDFIIDIDKMSSDEISEKIVDISRLPLIRICACIMGDDPEMQIKQASRSGASLVELRFDLISNPDIAALIQTSGLPVIATDRKNKDNLIKAIEEGCNYVDVEIESSAYDKIIEKAKAHNCRVIASLHDFEKTPENLSFDKKGADFLKIATKINTVEDGKRLLQLLQNRNDLIVIGMGKLGSFTRVIAPLFGSYLTYASVTQNTAPGQLSLKTMNEIYKRRGLR